MSRCNIHAACQRKLGDFFPILMGEHAFPPCIKFGKHERRIHCSYAMCFAVPVERQSRRVCVIMHAQYCYIVREVLMLWYT